VRQSEGVKWPSGVVVSIIVVIDDRIGSSLSSAKRWTGASDRVNGMKRKNMSEDFSSPPAKKKVRQSVASPSGNKTSVEGGKTNAPSEL
jgi:hypothetical protein